MGIFNMFKNIGNSSIVKTVGGTFKSDNLVNIFDKISGAIGKVKSKSQQINDKINTFGNIAQADTALHSKAYDLAMDSEPIYKKGWFQALIAILIVAPLTVFGIKKLFSGGSKNYSSNKSRF